MVVVTARCNRRDGHGPQPHPFSSLRWSILCRSRLTHFPWSTLSPVQVTRLDGLQHMHIPSGQTYKSPGMAYVEGDASSGAHIPASLPGVDLA
jgi:hypothetical protein